MSDSLLIWMDGAQGLAGQMHFDRWYYVGLALLLVLLAVLLVRAIQEWQEIHDVEEPATPAELLETFEQAHAAGELEDAELDRVRQLLARPSSGANEVSGTPAPEHEAQGLQDGRPD